MNDSWSLEYSIILTRLRNTGSPILNFNLPSSFFLRQPEIVHSSSGILLCIFFDLSLMFTTFLSLFVHGALNTIFSNSFVQLIDLFI